MWQPKIRDVLMPGACMLVLAQMWFDKLESEITVVNRLGISSCLCYDQPGCLCGCEYNSCFDQSKVWLIELYMYLRIGGTPSPSAPLLDLDITPQAIPPQAVNFVISCRVWCAVPLCVAAHRLSTVLHSTSADKYLHVRLSLSIVFIYCTIISYRYLYYSIYW